MVDVCRFPGCTRPQSTGTYFCYEEHNALWLKSTQRKHAFGAESSYETAVEDFITEHVPLAQPAEHPMVESEGQGFEPPTGRS